MARTLKIVITGPFNAGKTEFIKAISEIPVVTTERRLSRDAAPDKPETTVAMDFGRVTIGEHTFHLFGTPGQERFDFMWEILSREMDGFVVMVDSADPASFSQAKRLLRQFQSYDRVPYVVAANKQDAPGARSTREIREALGLPKSMKVVPCIATDPLAVKQILLAMAAAVAV